MGWVQSPHPPPTSPTHCTHPTTHHTHLPHPSPTTPIHYIPSPTTPPPSPATHPPPPQIQPPPTSSPKQPPHHPHPPIIPQLVTILVGDRGVGDRADLPWQRRQFWPSSAAFEHLRPHSAILSVRSCHMMPLFGDQTFRKKTTHRGRSRPVQSLIPQIYLDHLAEIAWMEPWKDII